MGKGKAEIPIYLSLPKEFGPSLFGHFLFDSKFCDLALTLVAYFVLATKLLKYLLVKTLSVYCTTKTMTTIPEIATQLVDTSTSNVSEDNARTIFIFGSKSVGKSSLLYSFLEKTDTPRETLVMEYSFGRKSNQKQGIEKSLCHIWEYGGLIETLHNVLPSIPIVGKYFFCAMVDLSNVKCIWEVLEACERTINTYSGSETIPETIIIGGKYDIFKNYDSDIKKLICTTIRSFALLHNAHILFYSSKEPPLVRKAKDMLQNIGFGNCIPIKDKNTNYSKPLFIPKGSDSWESIGVAVSTIEQIKMRYFSQIPPITSESRITTATQRHAYPESLIDSLINLKYDQLRTMESLGVSIDYILSINK